MSLQTTAVTYSVYVLFLVFYICWYLGIIVFINPVVFVTVVRSERIILIISL